MFGWFLLGAQAVATPIEARNHYESAAPILVPEDAAPRHVVGVELSLGEASLSLNEGWAVPVQSGRSAEGWADWSAEQRRENPWDDPTDFDPPSPALPVVDAGFMFTGSGTLRIPLPTRAERWSVANRLALNTGADPTELRSIVEQGVLELPVEKVVLVGVGQSLPASDSSVSTSARPMREAAAEILDDRFGTSNWGLAWERVLAETRGDGRAPVVRAQVYVGRRLGVVSHLQPNRRLAEDQWVEITIDPDGRVDAYDALLVEAGGWKLNWGSGFAELAAIPREEGRVRRAPIEADFADTTLKVRTLDDGVLAVQCEQTLTVRTTEAGVSTFALSIPRADWDQEEGSGWEFGGVTLEDGTPVSWWEPGSNDEKEASGWVPVVLPAPVEAGEVVTLRVRWQGGWRSATPSGWSTGLRTVLPSVLPGRVGSPWKYRTVVGVPEDSRLSAAVGGDTTRRWAEDGWTFVEVRQDERDAMWPDIAVGSWTRHSEAAVGNLPMVDVRLFGDNVRYLQAFPPEVRRVVSFYEGYLPPFPVRELEVFQAPTSWFGFTWIAPHGMVNLQEARALMATGSKTPHLESGVLAHEIAHQYWGHVARPASSRDFWLAETFAETYALMYLGAAFGPEVLESRLETARLTWEKENRRSRHFASLTHPYADRSDIVYRWGPYVFLRMLHARIGNEAFFSALDALARGFDHADVRTEDVQAAFEQSSGRDLDDFFDYWVRGGFRPRLELEWTLDGGRIMGTVTSSVPFGTFDVPVRISADSSAETVWVEVVDGRGSFTVEAAPPDPDVDLDPDHLVLALSRRVRAVGP